MDAARIRGRGRAAWFGLFAVTVAVAVAAVAPAAARGDDDAAAECLLPRGTVHDAAVPLRLAMPPMDPQNPGGTMQAVMSRLVSSPSSAGGAAQARVSEALSRLGPPAAPMSPTTRLLIDGGAGVLAGRHAEAERPLAECEQQALKQGDAFTASACANNLALAQAAQGQAERARASLERALRHLEAPRKPPADPKLPPQVQAMVDATMSRLGGVMAMMTPEQRAQFEAQLREQQASMGPQMRDAAMAVWRRADGLNARRASERATLNLGQLALATGRLADAQGWLQRAFDAPAGDDPPQCKAAAALDLARLYQRLGRADDSRALLARHRTAAVVDSDTTAFEMGAIRLALASAGAPAAAAVAAGDMPAAAAARPASFFDESSGRFSESSLARLLDEATRASPTDAAWQRLALRAAAARRADLGFAAQAALMRLAASRGDARAAIAHGKQAVNLAQGLRVGLADGTPSREARRAFLRERRQVYVALAQALLDQQRLIEAEAVLQLLKEDEGQQFIGGAASARPASLPLLPHEQAWQQQQDRVAARLREAEQQRIRAAAAMPLGGGALLLAGADQIEAARLKAGLALAELPVRLARKPPQRLSRDAAGQATVRDVRDFLVGPQARLERFLSHLIEDAPQFNPPAGPREMARLADTRQQLRDLQAALAPLLREEAWVDAPAGPTLTVRPAGSKPADDEFVLLGYTMAEPLERLWRTGREVDTLEARHLQSAAALPPEAAALAAPHDDTRALLAQQPVPTALLYYLPGDDRLDVLFVGAALRRHWRLDVPRRELDAQVQAFAEALRRSDRDPRPAAQALYQRLFAPVAATVAESGAQVLALSLADRLRFVPFAALHDGQGWLVERHALALHPGGALAGRLKSASARWQVAAFGASAGSGEFPPLPSVRGEIASVVRQDDASPGALPGQAWLDRDFTAERLRSALGSGAQVLHIASHFKFVGGDAQASYLLLGDGGRLSLRELAGPGYRFDRTELVTLSACATGLSADDTWGQEVDGLAALLMGQGAPAVLASLWEVNDRSTAALMGTLYRQREGRQLPRVLALQQAQLAMIRGAASTSTQGAAGARGASRIRLPGDPEPDPADAAFAPKVALGHGHPFHWAAFVLMGNWR